VFNDGPIIVSIIRIRLNSKDRLFGTALAERESPWLAPWFWTKLYLIKYL